MTATEKLDAVIRDLRTIPMAIVLDHRELFTFVQRRARALEAIRADFEPSLVTGRVTQPMRPARMRRGFIVGPRGKITAIESRGN